MDHYPARYTDANGTEEIVITNDGETLRMTVRNVEFTSGNFDTFRPSEEATTKQLSSFSLNRGYLCRCTIECEMPIPIHDNEKNSSGTLKIGIELGEPNAIGGLESEDLLIVLRYDGREFSGSGTSGWFEDELLEIQSQLPNGVHMRACINCMYSDYSPLGHSFFGDMMCFRNIKEEYVKIKTKDDFWFVHDRPEEHVQETYLCREFKRRTPGIGYRG